MTWIILAGLVFFQLSATAQTRVSTAAALSESPDTLDYFDSHPISPLIGFLVPAGLRDGYRLREYIATDEYKEEVKGMTDGEQMDEIYYAALSLSHGDRTRALLATAFGVFEHGSIQLRMPGFILSIPLTTESKAHFDQRVKNLPQHIYSSNVNDVDKLQHFYSSAWLERVLGMNWIARLAGDLVEIGEDAFVVGGVNDPRDKHANADGINFAHGLDGLGCAFELDIAPSIFLTPNP